MLMNSIGPDSDLPCGKGAKTIKYSHAQKEKIPKPKAKKPAKKNDPRRR